MRRLSVAATLVLAAALLSGCTLVPTASAPIVIRHVPFSLLSPTIPGTNGGRITFITQPVYIVDATDHLVPSSRIVPSPPSLDSVLQELALGPTQLETALGYKSELPKNLVILQSIVLRGVGYVTLSKPLTALARPDEVLAIGQLAMTALAAGVPNGIELLVAGVAVALPLPDGRTARHVYAKNYDSLLNV